MEKNLVSSVWKADLHGVPIKVVVQLKPFKAKNSQKVRILLKDKLLIEDFRTPELGEATQISLV